MGRTLLGPLGLLTLVVVAHTYEMYSDRIPNGRVVPHPCVEGEKWRGVGHRQPGGGGSRNTFGEDFADAGYAWTTDLCNADSDGDGRTNGEELGDPLCVWSMGNAPAVTEGISHPGVCEPADSAECRQTNTWLTCESSQLQCEGFSDSDVVPMTFAFPPTPVPSDSTSLWCKGLDMPTDTDYHVIASEPVLDNVNVIHHILIYSCDDDAELPSEPEVCTDSVMAKCQTSVFGWAVGAKGLCFDGPYGFKIGPNGITKMVMEVHWDNPYGLEGQIDGSGLKLYATPNLRPNDASMWVVGKTDLVLPPGDPEITVSGECKSRCTQHLEPFYIVGAAGHQHLTGRKVTVQQIRNGTVVMEIAQDFDFYNPTTTSFEEYQEVLPGDSFTTTCVYDTTDRVNTTYYGDGTRDEMCFMFFTYYPAQDDLDFCVGIENDGVYCPQPSADVCNYEFAAHPDFLHGWTEYLEPLCGGAEWCPAGCMETLQGVRALQACFREENWPPLREYYLTEMSGDGLLLVQLLENCSPDSRPVPPDVVGAASVLMATVAMTTISMVATRLLA